MRFSSSRTPPSVSNSALSLRTVTVIGRVMLESAMKQPSTLPGATASVNTARALGSTGPDKFGVGMLPPVWVQPANSAVAAIGASTSTVRMRSPVVAPQHTPFGEIAAATIGRPDRLTQEDKQGGRH